METVTIGVAVHAEPRNLRRTVDCLNTNTSQPFSLILLPDGPDEETVAELAKRSEYPQFATGEPRGKAACFNRLAQNSDADVIVLLESGVFVAPGWLERILAALHSDARYGLAGPSTNRAWNEQCIFPNGGPTPTDIPHTAQQVVRRYTTQLRTLGPLYSLADFCYVVRRNALDAVGAADEMYGTGPCWEMDYNIRSARAGFEGVWACGSYVYRSPATERDCRHQEMYFESSKRRYQDKFCGLRLSGQKDDYRAHCRGDSCSNFAPPKTTPKLVIVTLPATHSPAAELPTVGLVSCIMPTRDRRRFVPLAIRYFQRQDYPDRELVILDDGDDQVRDLVPDDPHIRYVRLDQRSTLGEKRNTACKMARGDIVLHWDDDDWMAAHRISYQVSRLRESNADICGLDKLLFYAPASDRAWRYVSGVRSRPWAAGGTLCYKKSFWKCNPFPPLSVGEDTRFVWSNRKANVLVLPDHTFYVAIVHDRNTSPKRTADPMWQPYPAPSVRELLGADAVLYGRKQDSSPLVSCIMPTFERGEFVPQAISYFQRQDYPNRELIIVEDGRVSIDQCIVDHKEIRYFRLEGRHALGEKRNYAVERARGEYIIHWDDDDWYAPSRISSQIRPLLLGTTDVTALAMRIVLELPEFRFWRCRPELHTRLHYRDLCCGTIAYPRKLWHEFGPYPGLSCGEDMRFLAALGKKTRVQRLLDEDLFVCVRHDRNTWRMGLDWKREPRSWDRVPTPRFFSTNDLEQYQRLRDNGMPPMGL